MFLTPYYSAKDHHILISRQQASQFAKQIANDFNPIHDADSTRFCVPGDLLFSLVLSRYGLCQKMSFRFAGMVTDEIPLIFPPVPVDQFTIKDEQGKEYLHVARRGDRTTDQNVITEFTQRYVAFSGKNFPDLIVPLMAEHDVMIHPDRPLVIYESMAFDLETVDLKDPVLELTQTSLQVTGKKGIALLKFCVKSAGNIIGTGTKKLALRGLMKFDQSAVDDMIARYMARKTRQ